MTNRPNTPDKLFNLAKETIKQGLLIGIVTDFDLTISQEGSNHGSNPFETKIHPR